MTNNAIAEALEHDHRAIDDELARFKAGLEQGEWRGESLVRAARALKHHIYVEEDVLFPALRETNLAAAVFVMLREHGEIWRALDNLEAGASGDAAGALAKFAALESALNTHNAKEEQILYPVSEAALDGERLGAVHQALHQGERPVDWLPQRLRHQPA